MHHIADKEGLLGLSLLADADVRQQLALQDLARVLHARLLGDARHAPALAYIVQRHLRTPQYDLRTTPQSSQLWSEHPSAVWCVVLSAGRCFRSWQHAGCDGVLVMQQLHLWRLATSD